MYQIGNSTMRHTASMLRSVQPCNLKATSFGRNYAIARASTSSASTISTGAVDSLKFSFEGANLDVPYETLGQGPPLVLCTSISTVSCRDEMREMANLFAPDRTCVFFDWPAIGNCERLDKEYKPEMFSKFVGEFIEKIEKDKGATDVMACGHGAAMLMHALSTSDTLPSKVKSIYLVAPTIYGPLRAMALPEGARESFRKAIQSPVLGQLIYFQTTTPSNIKSNYTSHVFIGEDKLTDDYIAQRGAVAKKKNARFAVSAFITGGLDLFTDPMTFGKALGALKNKVLVVVGDDYPRRSLAAITEACDVAKEENSGL